MPFRTYRHWVAAAVLGALLFAVPATAQDFVGCARALNPQPLGTKDAKGFSDVVVPAERNGKPGVYFYSGDRPVFVALGSSAVAVKNFQVSFKHPVSGRKVTIAGSNFDPKNPAALAIQKPRPNAFSIAGQPELAFDVPAISALDGYLAGFINQNAFVIPRSAAKMGLIQPTELRQWVDSAGTPDPKLSAYSAAIDRAQAFEAAFDQELPQALQAYANTGRKSENANALAKKFAGIYKTASSNFIGANTYAIVSFLKRLDNNCQLADLKSLSKQTQLAVAQAKSRLAVDAGVNEQWIKPRIAEQVEQGLPELFASLIEGGVTDPIVYKGKVAEHFYAKVEALRKDAQKSYERANMANKTMAQSPSPATH